MTEKTETLQELEREFKKMKSDLGFKSSMEELDKIFFVKDLVLKDGFVSERFSRRLCHRIVETYMDWNGYLHSIVMPNPQSMLNLMESKLFSQEEKKDIMEMMKKIMELSSRNSVIALTFDKKKEAKFIDDAVSFWENEFREKLEKIMVKVNSEWDKKS